jgi:integrase
MQFLSGSKITKTQAFSRISGKAGLSRVRLHDLRHTHATLVMNLNVHPKVLSERLGHSSTKLTMDTYSHVLPGMQASAGQSSFPTGCPLFVIGT